ncbi:MAG TPA: hypothetical protein VNY24_15305 [Candidatus Acidoferrales bacterium]|jgi:hypothetical protein|nr:hypothetical protein [Candidatus Acidoferrales bacterium]
MKILFKLLSASLLLLLVAIPAHGQYIAGAFNSGAVTQFPGWTFLQETFVGGNQGGSTTCATPKCTTSSFPTTAGSAWVIMVQTTNNVSILRVCTNDTTCAAGNDNWQLCANCNVTQSHTSNMAYNVSGTTASTSFTVIMSGATGAEFFVLFVEVLPPTGQTASFDNAATASSAGCTSCTMAAPTITATDAVIHYPLSVANPPGASTVHIFTNPWFQDANGIVSGLNVTSGTTVPSYPQPSGDFRDSAIAFKSSLGSFTPSSGTTFYQLVHLTDPGINGISCIPTCAITVPSTGAGNLLAMLVSNSSAGHLVSVNGGGSWVVPTGANSCQVTVTGNTNEVLSCGYTLSSAGGTTTITPTVSTTGTYTFVIYEVSRASGSWTFDTQGSAQTAATQTVNGVGLTLTGTSSAPDAVFQSFWCPGGCNANTLYPLAGNFSGNGNDFAANSGGVALLNTLNGAAPIWGTTGVAGAVTGFAFK